MSGLTLADVTKYGRPGIRAQLFNTRAGTLEMDFRIEVGCDAFCIHGSSSVWFLFLSLAVFRPQAFDFVSDSRRRFHSSRFQGDKNSTHVINVISPGWTCSLPFAAHVCDIVEKNWNS